MRSSRTLLQLWAAMGRPSTYAVGGFVRDRLLGRTSADVDLVLEGDAPSIEQPARRLGRHLGARPHLLGTPPRCIWRIDGRGLKVELWPRGALSLEKDVHRRDFTCNALMWRLPDGPLVDLVGGVADIERRQLRAVRRDNLERDPVRLLRAARFLAQLGSFELEATTLRWVRELAPRLATAPRERVGAELLALLRASDATRGVTALLDLGLLAAAAPTRATVDHAGLARHRAAADILALPARHPLRSALVEAGDSARLALVLCSWPGITTRQCSSYGWPRNDLRRAMGATGLLDRTRATLESSAADRRELIHDAGASCAALVALGSAVAAAANEPIDPWRRLWRIRERGGQALTHPTPLLSAGEISELSGLEPGPELGRIFRDLLRLQVRGELRSKNGARRWLRDHRRTKSIVAELPSSMA